MLPIPRKYAHFVFGVIQSGLTSGIASFVASLSLWTTGRFVKNWLSAWGFSWLLMLPIVLLAAPAIRGLATALTRPDEPLT